MKLYLCIFFALSLLGAALSSPLDENLRRTYQTAYGDDVDTQYFQPYRANANAQEYTTEDDNRPDAQYQYYPIDMEGKSCKIFVRMLANYSVWCPQVTEIFGTHQNLNSFTSSPIYIGVLVTGSL